MNDIERAILQLGVQMGHDDRVITDESCDIAISALENNEQLKRDLAAQNEYSERLAERLRATNNLLKKARKKQLNSWIPVGERLPEEYGCYLVAWRPTVLTAEDIIKNTGTVPHYYEMVEYDPDDEALWIGGIEQCDSYEILAWQPLPPAYVEVENE